MFEIEKYFSPTVRFKSLKEMIDAGNTTDEIFDGPLLENGFIDTDELIEADLRNEVRLSDLMKIIMKIDGVKLIKEISIGHCSPDKEKKNDWLLCIDKDKKPTLCENSSFSYHKGVLPLNINEKKVDLFLKELKEEEEELQEKAKESKTLKLPEGIYSGAKDYTSILNDFPDTYGIGQEGLSAIASAERRSQATKIKSY